MKSVIISFALLIISLNSNAIVKGPGSVIPVRCGSNELKKAGPSVVTVCEANVVGDADKGLVLVVSVNKGAVAMDYLYEFYVPEGLRIEPTYTAGGVTYLKHFKLSGLVVAGMAQRLPLIALPKDETYVVVTVKGNLESMTGKFFGMDFSGKIEQVMISQFQK